MEKIFMISYLVWNTWTDLRRKEISLAATGIFLLLEVIFKLLNSGLDSQVLYGIVPGMVFILISAATSGAIGMGDGIVISFVGGVVGIWKLSIMLFIAMFLVFITAGILLLIKRKKRNYEIPFIPFLLMAYILQEVMKL